MHTYEERMRAVELYIKLGKRWSCRVFVPLRVFVLGHLAFEGQGAFPSQC